MTMSDDPAFLLFLTKAAFITSDETGACELVMENEDFLNNKTEKQRSFSFLKKERPIYSSESDSELSHSPDIVPDMDYCGHRFRSNTAQRLEKLLAEKHNQSKIKRITWKQAEKTDVNYSDIFEDKEVKSLSGKVSKKSLLSQQIEEFNKIAAGNTFGKYAKFDGKALYGTNKASVKKIDIFLTMAPPTERSYVMTVVTALNAKMRDLIGLICWQYSIEKREPKLKQDVNLYDLYMAEDNGEADKDFPPLDPREPVTKFDFARLALVEKSSGTSPLGAEKKSNRVSGPLEVSRSSDLLEKFNIGNSISVHIPGTGMVIVNVRDNNKDYKNVGDVIVEVITKEKLDSKYHLERSDKPGVSLDNDLNLRGLDTNDLCLIKSSSSSSLVATYTVNMLQKFRPTTEVYLVISEKKFEIHPLKQSVSFSMRQVRPVYNLDSILDCQKMEDKLHSGGQTFRVTVKMSTGKIKQRMFACDANVADEIVTRLNKMIAEKSKITFSK